MANYKGTFKEKYHRTLKTAFSDTTPSVLIWKLSVSGKSSIFWRVILWRVKNLTARAERIDIQSSLELAWERKYMQLMLKLLLAPILKVNVIFSVTSIFRSKPRDASVQWLAKRISTCTQTYSNSQVPHFWGFMDVLRNLCHKEKILQIFSMRFLFSLSFKLVARSVSSWEEQSCILMLFMLSTNN